MNARIVRFACWALFTWFDYACELTGHWHACALLRYGPGSWALDAYLRHEPLEEVL